MDDYKCNASSKQAMKTFTAELKKALAEIRLSVNLAKCRIYCRNGIEQQEDDAPFLPEIKEGYKYLGLDQLERDTENLTTQNFELFNSTIIPAIIYVMLNI